MKKFVACLLRWAKANLRKPFSQDKANGKGGQERSPVIEPITVAELREAERSIIKCVKEEHIKVEIESLKLFSKIPQVESLSHISLRTAAVS